MITVLQAAQTTMTLARYIELTLPAQALVSWNAMSKTRMSFGILMILSHVIKLAATPKRWFEIKEQKKLSRSPKTLISLHSLQTQLFYVVVQRAWLPFHIIQSVAAATRLSAKLQCLPLSTCNCKGQVKVYFGWAQFYRKNPIVKSKNKWARLKVAMFSKSAVDRNCS